MDFKNLKVGDLLELGHLMPDLSSEQVECLVMDVGPGGVVLEAYFYGVPMGQFLIEDDIPNYVEGIYGV